MRQWTSGEDEEVVRLPSENTICIIRSKYTRRAEVRNLFSLHAQYLKLLVSYLKIHKQLCILLSPFELTGPSSQHTYPETSHFQEGGGGHVSRMSLQ